MLNKAIIQLKILFILKHLKQKETRGLNRIMVIYNAENVFQLW